MAQHERFHIKSLAALSEEARRLGITIPCSEETGVLFESLRLKDGHTLANRFVVQPMEGFDADEKGIPGKLAFRRYMRYGAGGSGLIWFEACAVVPEGRSNPHQFYINQDNYQTYKELVAATRKAVQESPGEIQQPLLILQLTHSGRYSKPTGKPAPIIAHHSPILDPLHNLPADYPLVTDAYLDTLQEHYIAAAKLAAAAGFDGVDIKSCHRYLVSELHASFTRIDSRYGGNFDNRTRFIREVMTRIRAELPELLVSTRLNAYDAIPHPYGFGVSAEDKLLPDLNEPLLLIKELRNIGIPILNLSIGNPYYEPHFGRPFDFPVKGGVVPGMHPLENIARIFGVTRAIQEKNKELPVICTGFSWLRQFIPHVGAGVVSQGWAALVGQGRNSFAYPDAVQDLKTKGYFDKSKVCVSCSCCTQLMRDGGNTGCVIRDSEIYAPLYRQMRQASLDALKTEAERCRNCETAACTTACPAQVDIPGFIRAFSQGDIAGAYRILKASNPLPETCAYICPVEVQCEGSCMEKLLTGNPIPVHEIQKRVARLAREQGLAALVPAVSNGKAVAVIGAGPAGLACAAALLEAGFHIDLFDPAPQPGGTPGSVIPAERLAQDESLAEIRAVFAASETNGSLVVHYNRGLSADRPLEWFSGQYTAVFLGMGLGQSIGLKAGERVPVPEGVLDAVTFLKAAKANPGGQVPDQVYVLGGGNTAIDAALTAKRMGAGDVSLVYRRSFGEMPAWPGERDKALAAGIHLLILTQPLDYIATNNKLTGLKVCRTRLGEPDASGRRAPVAIPGSECILPAGLVIEALGQAPHAGLERLLSGIALDKNGFVVSDPLTRRTSHARVFAGGDMVNGAGTAVQAVCDGMAAARAIIKMI